MCMQFEKEKLNKKKYFRVANVNVERINFHSVKYMSQQSRRNKKTTEN